MEAWATATAAIVAALGFVVSIYKTRSDRREQETREWQKTAVFRYLSKRDQSGTTLDEVLQWYRTEAYSQIKELPKSDLTEAALRRVILELLADHAIEMTGNDLYRVNLIDISHEEIRQQMAGAMSGMLGFQNTLINDVELKKFVYKLIGSAPNKMSIDEVVVKIVEDTLNTSEEARAFLAQEVAQKKLYLDSAEKIGFGSKATIEG